MRWTETDCFNCPHVKAYDFGFIHFHIFTAAFDEGVKVVRASVLFADKHAFTLEPKTAGKETEEEKEKKRKKKRKEYDVKQSFFFFFFLLFTTSLCMNAASVETHLKQSFCILDENHGL